MNLHILGQIHATKGSGGGSLFTRRAAIFQAIPALLRQVDSVGQELPGSASASCLNQVAHAAAVRAS